MAKVYKERTKEDLEAQLDDALNNMNGYKNDLTAIQSQVDKMVKNVPSGVAEWQLLDIQQAVDELIAYVDRGIEECYIPLVDRESSE